MFSVVASVVERNGALLLCRRASDKRYGGLWEFPGGKVDPGESEFEAVRRELREELGLEVTAVGPAQLTVNDPGSPFVIHFLPVTAHGEPRCIEHTMIRWVTPGDLPNYPLAPSDRSYVAHLLGRDLE